MKNKPSMVFLLGLVLLAIGGIMSLAGGPPRANAAAVAQCRERMADQGADMLAKCDEAAFATAMTATDGDSAARAISAANTSEIGGNALAMFLMGIGAALTIGGLVLLGRSRRAPNGG